MEQCVDTEKSKCCESDLIAEGSAMKRKLGSRDCCEKGRFVQIVPRWRKTGEEAYEETLRGTIWDWPRKLQKVKGNYWGRKPWGKKYNVKWSYKLTVIMRLSISSSTIPPPQDTTKRAQKTLPRGQSLCTKNLSPGQNRESKAPSLAHKVRKFHKCIWHYLKWKALWSQQIKQFFQWGDWLLKCILLGGNQTKTIGVKSVHFGHVHS